MQKKNYEWMARVWSVTAGRERQLLQIKGGGKANKAGAALARAKRYLREWWAGRLNRKASFLLEVKVMDAVEARIVAHLEFDTLVFPPIPRRRCW